VSNERQVSSVRKKSVAAVLPKVIFDGHLSSLDSIKHEEPQFDSMVRPSLPVKDATC